MRKNRFNNQIDMHEAATTAAAMIIILAVVGVLATWYFQTWAGKAGLNQVGSYEQKIF